MPEDFLSNDPFVSMRYMLNGKDKEPFLTQRKYDLDDWNDLYTIPLLPVRVCVKEFKDFGLVNLHHTVDKETEPWIPSGLYRYYNGKRLYFLEVKPGIRGITQTVWMIRPIFRVKAGGVGHGNA